MAAFTEVLAKAYADFAANGASWTADFAQVQGMVKMIGGNPEDVAEALALLGFPTAEEQASATWLGGGAEGGAVKALVNSAAFLEDQRQIDSVLDDYSPHVNASYAEAAAE